MDVKLSNFSIPTVIAWIFGILLAFEMLGFLLEKGRELFSQTEGIIPNTTEEWQTIAKMVMFAVIALGGWAARKDTPVWTKRAFYGAVALLFVYGASTIFFGSRFTNDPFAQEVYNIRTAEPEYMVYKDSGGRWRIGYEKGERLSPKDCRPANVGHFTKDGRVFPYETRGTCVSPTDNRLKMIPKGPEHTVVLPDWRPFKTAAEIEAEEAAEAAEQLEERRQAAMATRMATRQYVEPVPPGARTRIKVPACGGDDDWAREPIPAKWYVDPSWNVAAADYEYRDTETGEWREKPSKNGSDAIRFCAKVKRYVGDEMLLTWTKL